jgi:hypothetical protein
MTAPHTINLREAAQLAFIGTLSPGAQANIQDAIQRGESHTADAFAAGYNAALAVSDAQPVAQWQKRNLSIGRGGWQNTDEHDAKWWVANAPGWKIRALYAAPIVSIRHLPADDSEGGLL